MELLVLSPEDGTATQVLPALELLSHHARVAPLDISSMISGPLCHAVIVDARSQLVAAKTFCRLYMATGMDTPLIVLCGQGGLPVISADWGLRDLLIDTASPAEVEARLRLVSAPPARGSFVDDDEEIDTGGDLVIDAGGYTARLAGVPLDLTFKEFELLKYLVQHPGRAITRAQLLQEVWGYDYYGGTRTVDVHIRRLRSKLGMEYEHLIGTVRSVGYRFDASAVDSPTAE